MQLYRLTGAVLLAVTLDAAEPVSQQRLELSKSSAEDARFSSLLDRYARGEASVELPDDVTPLEWQRQFRRAGSRWIGSRDAAATGQRRLAVATFALELIDKTFEAAWDRQRGFALELLEWSCDLLRDAPVTAAERSWQLAAVAQLEQASAFHLIRSPVSLATGNSAFVRHIVHAEQRFPDDGQWTLARAIDIEHAVWPPMLDEDVLRPFPEVENRIRSRLEAAFKKADVSAEAHLRWGYFHLRRGRLAQALTELDKVDGSNDRAIQYWKYLFRGQTFVRMNRSSDASESFQRALAVYPHAQAAALSLASTLAQNGQLSEAERAVHGMLGAAPRDDPWNVYGFPAYRHWPGLIRQLRTAIAP